MVNQRHEDSRAADTRNEVEGRAPTATPYAAEQIATPPSSFPFIDSLRVHVMHGPWAGGVIHLPNADAIQAIADKWAVDFAETPFDPNVAAPPLMTPEDVATATAAAETYAANFVLEVPAAPPLDGETQRGGKRDTRAEQGRTVLTEPDHRAAAQREKDEREKEQRTAEQHKGR